MSDHHHEAQRNVRRTLSLISPVTALNTPKVRIGGARDGGYVMLDRLDGVELCYSLGVGPDVSWDRSMAERGAHIYQYDHTVEAAPDSHPNFHFFRTGIANHDSEAPMLKRIDTIIGENGHRDRDGMILKIDIEGHEWDSLDAIDSATIGRFTQIVAEFHGMRLLAEESFLCRAHRLFAKLAATHRVVHAHGNNFGDWGNVVGIPVPDVLELTFARRRDFDFGPSDEIFPTHLDQACNADRPDLYLGAFHF
jgi:methyltransferase FkbM-like protein